MFAKNILEAEKFKSFAKLYVLLINLVDSRMFPLPRISTYVMENGSLKIWLLEGW